MKHKYYKFMVYVKRAAHYMYLQHRLSLTNRTLFADAWFENKIISSCKKHSYTLYAKYVTRFQNIMGGISTYENQQIVCPSLDFNWYKCFEEKYKLWEVSQLAMQKPPTITDS